MKWPQFMSKDFRHLKEAESLDEAFEALTERGLKHVIDFFIESSEDKTWITGGGEELMNKLYSWLVQEYREDRLSESDAQRIALAIQGQFEALQCILDYDVDFVIEGETIPVCGFMYQAQSPFFKELIRKAKPAGGRKTIEMRKAKLTFFDYIKEFVYTGKIEFLWREEPKYIFNFIRQAQNLGMSDMALYASSVYKRYLTSKNVIPHLQLAQREFLKELEEQCCSYINEQNYGISIDFQENVGLEVTLYRITGLSLALIEFLSKQISYLNCAGHVPENSEIAAIIGKIPRLVGLNLSKSSEISPDLIEHFPPVKQLDLAHCSWLDDDRFLAIIEKCKGLTRLNLSHCTHLSFRSLGELTTLSRLTSLNLSYCDQLNDDDFDLVASSCPQLAELNLEFCRITDEGIEALARQCQNLSVVNLKDCKNVTPDGIQELKRTLPRLTVET